MNAVSKLHAQTSKSLICTCASNFLKTGIIIPLYKSGGKNPLDANSYKEITLTSVLAKVFESFLLACHQDHLAERGIPHSNQTAYLKGISCTEVMFDLNHFKERLVVQY